MVDVNENKELETSIKIYAGVMQEYPDGKATICNPQQSLADWAKMQRIVKNLEEEESESQNSW